jgi:hypothetical protein
VSTIWIMPPSPTAALDADGMTVDTYLGTRAPANSLVTVASTLGTVMAADDMDATLQGSQVRANDAGAFTFHLLRPSGLSTNPQTATITAQDVEGRGLGQGTPEFQSPQVVATVMRFDFNSSAYTQADFLPVGPRDIYNGTRGYGWSVRVAAADRNPGPSWSSLNRDLHTGSNAKFRVQVDTGQTYHVRVYLANPLGNGTYAYTYDNFDVGVEGGATQNIALLQPNAITVLNFTGIDTGPNADGILDIQFLDRGGQNFNWVVSGIELSTGSLPAAINYLLAEALPSQVPTGGLKIDDAALTPVLAASPFRPSSFDPHPSSLIPHPSPARSAEAVEPLGQAQWRRGLDDVFADLARETAQDRGEDGMSTLLESQDQGLLAAATVKSGEEATQARVPRRSRLQRYERELDAWFSELAAEDGGEQ